MTDLYIDESLCMHMQVCVFVHLCLNVLESAYQKSAATLIFEQSLELTRELVAVAGCESSVSAAICCHNIRVT